MGVYWNMLSCLVIRKRAYFSHNLHYHNTFLPSLTNNSISSGFDEGPPSEKRNVLWLVSCPSALWLANSLGGFQYCPAPCQNKTASSSILPYQFRPREYWTRGLCRTFARTDIARHIKVVILLFYFFAKPRVREDVNNSLKITALTMFTNKCNGIVYCSLIITL